MAKKAKVDQDVCIGCGLCVGSHPSIFEFGDDGKAQAIEAGDDAFVVEIEKMVKPEGAKRKVKVLENVTLKYNEIKYTKYLIDFK